MSKISQAVTLRSRPLISYWQWLEARLCSRSTLTCLGLLVHVTDYLVISPISGKTFMLMLIYTEICVACSNQTRRVSKCRQFFLQRRGLDPMLFQCWSSAVGSGQNLVFAGLHTGVCLHPTLLLHNIYASRSRYF